MGSYRIIALVLMLAQALIGTGVGPRAMCWDADGSMCVDSVLSPCCCHRDHSTTCCEDEASEHRACDASNPSGRLSNCQCVCSPVATQPTISHDSGLRAKVDADFGVAVMVVSHPLWIATTSESNRYGSVLWTGPPSQSLRHLNSVILRL
jgi:hypothetical protein